MRMDALTCHFPIKCQKVLIFPFSLLLLKEVKDSSHLFLRCSVAEKLWYKMEMPATMTTF